MVFTCDGKPLVFGHIVVDDDGTIIDIVDTGGKLIEEEGLEYHNGVLVPGFIIESKTDVDAANVKRMRNMTGVQFETKDVKNIAYNTRELVVNQMFGAQLSGASFADALANATIEPARMLGVDDKLGCFKKGANPGVVLLYPFDFVNVKMRHDTLSKRLV